MMMVGLLTIAVILMNMFGESGKEAFAARDIKAGEELTIDYSGLACPKWYKELCQKYDVMTTAQVVEFEKMRRIS